MRSQHTVVASQQADRRPCSSADRADGDGDGDRARARAVMSAALTVVTPVVNYLLIYGLALGLDGAALANNVEAGLYCGMLAIYFVVKERGLVKSGRHTWHGWRAPCLKVRDKRNLTRLGVCAVPAA